MFDRDLDLFAAERTEVDVLENQLLLRRLGNPCFDAHVRLSFLGENRSLRYSETRIHHLPRCDPPST